MARNQKSCDYIKEGLKHVGVVVLGVVVFAILVCIFIFLPLWKLDVNHAEIAGRVEAWTGNKHYFKGETWFSALASCIAALPGIFCGLFALMQTHRLSKLDARYHRPVLLLRKATMKVWRLKGYDTSNDSAVFYDYVEKKSTEHSVLMKMELEFEVKNETEVKLFEIEKITWKTSQDIYSLKLSNALQCMQLYDEKSFWREYDGDRIICHVEKYIEPCEKVPDDEIKKFENSVEMFANYENRKDDDYKKPEIILVSNIAYEYSKAKQEKLECRMQWDAQEECYNPKDFYTVHKTCDGYFSYDIKNKNR